MKPYLKRLEQSADEVRKRHARVTKGWRKIQRYAKALPALGEYDFFHAIRELNLRLIQLGIALDAQLYGEQRYIRAVRAEERKRRSKAQKDAHRRRRQAREGQRALRLRD